MSTNVIVTHACGHGHARDLSDTAASQRPDKAKQRAKPVSKERKAEWEAHRQAALEDAQRMNLPPLQGSDKQIGYGTELRYDLLRGLYDELMQSGRMSEDEYDEKVTVLARRINRAKFWLDHKESSTEDLLTDLADPGDQNIGTENPY